MTKSQDSAHQTIKSYKKLLQVIFGNTPIISQTSKSPDDPPVTSLTPNYLCLQCSATCTAKDRPKHGALTKHRLCKSCLISGTNLLLTLLQMQSPGAAVYSVKCAMISSGILPWRNYEFVSLVQVLINNYHASRIVLIKFQAGSGNTTNSSLIL